MSKEAKMMDIFSAQLKTVTPSPIHTFSEAVDHVPNILKLTIGEPDFNVPEHIKQAAVAAISSDDSHYSVSAGTLALRQAASQFFKRHYDLNYRATTDILITIGATEALYVVLASILDENDEILIPTPAYPVYAQMTRINGGQPVLIDVSDDDFVLTPEKLKQTIATHHHIKAIIINNPSNPTGITYTETQIKALVSVLKDTNILIISDEIYSELTYNGQHESIARYLPEQTVVINGVSKAYAMTGYRIGVLAGPTLLINEFNKVHSFIIMTPSNPAMAAAKVAFSSQQSLVSTAKMKQDYQHRRDYLVKALKQLEFECIVPNGAFYIFAKVPDDFIQDDVAFANDLVDKVQLAVVAGSGFAPGGAGYIRVSYAAAMSKLEEAVARLTCYAGIIRK